MRRTKMVVELGSHARPVLVRWSSQTSAGVFHDAYALRSAAGPILIDPEAVTPETRPRLEALLGRMGGRPVATILTSSMHERACYAVRRRWGTPVWMPRVLREHAEGTPDHVYDEGTALPGGLQARLIDPAGRSNAVLLWSAPGGRRVLFTADLILGQADPDTAGPTRRRAPGIYLWMYGHREPEQFKACFRRLLDDEFDLICGGHCLPIRDDPKAALARLLATGDFQTGPFPDSVLLPRTAEAGP